MQFLTFEQAQRMPYDRQYRHSPITTLAGLLVVTSILIACVCLGYLSWLEGKTVGVVITGWVAFWFGLLALWLWGATRRRLLPSNWLLRTHTNEISIKFRSYLNHHLDPNDAIVVSIQYSEIEFARIHRLRQDVPGDTQGATETRFIRFAEFKLTDKVALQELDARIAAERARKGPMSGRFIRHGRKDGDYPTQVSDGYLRIQWWVWPRLPRLMSYLSTHLPVKDVLSTREDFRDLRKAPTRDQEDALLRLIADGNRFVAIRVIRQIYGYDMTRAVQFLEDLTQPKR